MPNGKVTKPYQHFIRSNSGYDWTEYTRLRNSNSRNLKITRRNYFSGEISNHRARHDSSQFFVWSLTVGGWNYVNTPYKTTQKTRLLFSVSIILASKLELDSSICSKNGETRWCLHLPQGAFKRSGDGIQNRSVCSPGACFYNQIWISLFWQDGWKLLFNHAFWRLDEYTKHS